MPFKSSYLWPYCDLGAKSSLRIFDIEMTPVRKRIFVMSRNLRRITHTCEIFRNHPLNIYSIDWQSFQVVFKISNLLIEGKIIPYIFWHWNVTSQQEFLQDTQKSSLKYFFNWLQIKPGNCLVECCYLLVTYVLQKDKRGETEQ